MSDPNCAALLEAAAVMLALSVHTDSSSSTQRASAVRPLELHAPTPLTRDAPPSETSLAPEVPNHATRARQSGVFVDGNAAYGVVPRMSASVGLGALLVVGHTGGRLGAHYVLPADTGAGLGVAVHGFGATLLVTHAFSAPVRLGTGVQLHMLEGRGQGVVRPRQAWIQLWAARLELGVVALERRRNALVAVLGAGVPFVRPSFVVKDRGRVYRPAPFELTLGLRWELDFP